MRESDLLNYIYQSNAALPADVTIPPGDDMGAVRIGGQTVLVTVDQVADGVHVDLATTPIEKIGRKAITRNLSDVAAMAAKPAGAVAAACLPRDFGEKRANDLFDAMRATAEHYNCPLIGGDIAMWDGRLLLTVTIFAEPAGIEPVTRRGARLGDMIYVTGELGGSLQGHHLNFEPRLALARTLSGNSQTRPRCMIDLSDGLACDLKHLCSAATIDEASLPMRRGVLSWRNAIGDGEDYELCFTVDPARAESLPKAIDGVPITQIGVVEAEDRGMRLRLTDGSLVNINDGGWEHHS